jgi:predicted Zn-dependent peptidase
MSRQQMGVRTYGRAGVRLSLAATTILCAGATARLSAQQADRTRPPALSPAPALRIPTARTARLANGIEIAVVEMHEVPVVDVTLLVRAGSARDPRDLPGLATFAAGMLDEGAGRRSALEIAEEAAFLGAQFATGAGYEWATASLHIPKRRLAAGLDLLADVVLRPTFPDSEVARQRDLRLTGILQLRDNPTAQAPLAWNAIVYGADHPYAWPQNGTEASSRALTRDAVQGFYDTYFRPNNARILLVGDITLAEARGLVQDRFGAWTRGDVPALTSADAPAPASRTFYLVDKPGAAQSVIRIGHIGITRDHPDYYAIQVLNTILGGSFTSRLNQNLRETHAYTYGAGSSFQARRLPGPFIAQASVVTAKTDSSLIEFFRELRRIRDSVVPGEELAKAKAYLTLGLPGDFETTQGTAGRLGELWQSDLPLTWYGDYARRINAVTAADVQRVARRHIRPDEFAVVVVGDRAQIEDAIRGLNEGAISLRDLWGQEVR